MSVILNFEEEKIFRQWFTIHMANSRDVGYSDDMRHAYEAGVTAERTRAVAAHEKLAEEVKP